MSNIPSTISPEMLSVSQHFRLCASRYPKNIALEYKKCSLDYQSLEFESNRLAAHLQQAGVRSGSLVGVYLNRSPQLIVAFLALLKTGAAYVPIDPTYPSERVTVMIAEAGVSMLLTDVNLKLKAQDMLPFVQVMAIDEILSYHSFVDNDFEDCSFKFSPAYVMFTSGSTGKPKGVIIEHGSIVDLVTRQHFVNWHPGSVVLSTGSPSFDATTFEYWGPLLNGGKLVLCDENDLLVPEVLQALIEINKVNLMWFTAGLFNLFVDTNIELFSPLHTVIAGGDRLSAPHVRLFKDKYPSTQLINGYGPTECCTFSLTHLIQPVLEGSIPIGKPLNNRSAYVLDEAFRMCQTGETGELFIGGAGLASGYLNDQELTAKRFLWIELTAGKKMRLYRTGDLSRINEKGDFEFLGRKDDQVKIHGYRVEPAEIERTIMETGLVREVTVLATENDCNRSLIAYIKPVHKGKDTAPSVNTFIKQRMPAFMLPQEIIEIDTWPLTTNGKVDKKKASVWCL